MPGEGQGLPALAQSAAIARALASICNDERAFLGVMIGHERKTLRRSALGRGIGHFTVIEPPAITSPADHPRFPRPAQFAPAESLPDAHCVMHLHTTATMAVCCLEEGLSFTNFYAAQLHGKVA